MVQGGSSASPAKGLFFGESLTKVYRAYMGGDIVWDAWKAILSAPDFSVPAKAVEVKDHIQVESKGTDYEKVSHSMPYTLSPESIGKNTSSLARTVDVTIQQTQSKEKIVVKATQSANQVAEVKFDIPTVVSVSASVVPAKGGVSTLIVSWSQVKTTNYSNGSSTTETLTGTSVATVTNGGDIVTGSKIENGKVSVPSAGTSTYNGSRKAYTIMAYTFTVNGVKKNVSGVGIVVMQSQNSVSYSYATPVLTATYTDVGANGSAASLTLQYTQVRTNSYTSEVPPTTTSLSGTISKTATSGIYISAISGSNNKNGASVVVTSGSSSRGNVTADNLTTNPTSRAEVLKVSISASVNGKSATVSVSVYQQANVRTETGKTGGVTTYGNVVAGKITNATIPASGGNATATAGNGSQSWSTTAVETSYTHTSGSPLTLVTTAASSGTDTIYPSHASLYASALQKPASDSPVTTVKSQAVTWNGSGNKSASGTMYVYQQANAVTSYGAITITSHGSVASDIPASGGSRAASGGSGSQTVTYTSKATRAGSVTCGTYSTVSAGSLDTTPKSRTKIGTSSAKLTGEGGMTATVSVDVYQQANARSANPTSYGSWVVDCSHYNGVTTNIVATGGTMQVIVNSYRVNTYTWTSEAEEKVTQYGTGTITKTNIDSLSATSFTGKSGGVIITATIGENPTKDQRTCTVTATSSSVTKSASRTQNASVFALSATPPLVDHGGGNYTLQIISTRNGKAFKPSVSVSGISGASVVSITLATNVSTTGLYYCVISFPANSSTSSRTLTASISQTGGNSMTTSITQSGVPVTILGIGYYAGGFAFYKNPLSGAVNYNRITVSGKWSSEGPEWTGGTLVDARAVVSNTNTGTGTVISSLPLGSITLPQDGLADFGDNGAGLRGSEQAKYVLLYWGSPSQLNQVVEIPPAGAEPKLNE